MLDEQKFKELYHRQKESGLSVREFCANEAIAPSTYYYWQKKLKGPGRLPGFIPLVVDEAEPPAVHPNRIAAQEPPPGLDGAIIELAYPNGTTLRIRQGLDLQHLRTLLHLCD